MEISSQLKKDWYKVLPVGSAFGWSKKQKESPDVSKKEVVKLTGHVLYGVIGVSYLIGVMATVSLNPLKQVAIDSKRIEEKDKKYNMVFGTGGYADVNHDGEISFEEKLDAYEKLGLEGRIIFTQLNSKDIDSLIKTYEYKPGVVRTPFPWKPVILNKIIVTSSVG